ncbi:protein prenyltransferase alpha subunit repeat-containing protein 1-like [Porites lutea]|uniref:protein prenyltransferase alpha subunit repeat-containing protein 1-like n=1 Tax=Porites lutea TaxID=51062 RepID=UPI003CC5C8AE
MAATCCSVDLGEKLFCSLNQAFIVDPEIDEIDIIPCMHCQEEHNDEKEDPFIIVSHKLGIKSWCIKPLFLFAYNKLIRSRIKGKKDCNLSVTESVQLSRAVLLVNAECYTAWNARKEMITSGVLNLVDDWKFSGVVLSKHPRSAETFSHRKWTIVQLEKHKGQGEFIQSYLRTELAITLRAAECYADNYTAWSHRAWLVDRFMYDKKKKLFCELQGIRAWAESHISDNCCFHHRQLLLRHLKNVCSKGEVVHLLLSEVEFITDLILTFPGHEVLWYHRRFVYHISNHWFPDVGPQTVREIANGPERNGDCNTDNINRTTRRTSPSIIPSLLELASSSFKILTESKSRSRLKTPITDGTFLPLSASSEFKFCDGVIAECKGPEGVVQRSCALNYKRWLLIRSTPHQLNCNGAAFTPKVVTEAGLS